MKTLKFEGYSDDTFACLGPKIDVDHDTCASGKPVAMLVASAEQGAGIIVVGQYAPGHAHGWLIGVSPYDPTGWQRSRKVHPFTCGDRADHPVMDGDKGVLVPTVRGWICPFCDYTQDWAHSFMCQPVKP